VQGLFSVRPVGSQEESSQTPFAVWSNVGTLREYAEARRFIFRGNARLGFVLQQLAQCTGDTEISPDAWTRHLRLTVHASQSAVKQVFI
jgi:hypothetical protein